MELEGVWKATESNSLLRAETVKYNRHITVSVGALYLLK